ncbi:MAG: response regulator [Sinobacterium sp.]|nr:response regulator [Sinobacterium sp.]
MPKLPDSDLSSQPPENVVPVTIDINDFNQLGGDSVTTSDQLTYKLKQQVKRGTRERAARKVAEESLDKKNLEMSELNQQLMELTETLQLQVDEKTRSLEDALEQAKEATVLKSQFIATISHEMRTPLNAIIGFSDRMLTKSSICNDDKERYTRNIFNASQQLLGLINDVLDFEKIASNKLTIDNVEFNIKEMLESVVETVGVLADENNVNIGLSFDDKVPNIIFSDSLRVQQISYNLLSNALKFSKNNFVAVECRLFENKDDVLEVVVADQGIGMTDEQLDKLFIPFTQADGSMARKFGGSGLGLSICKSLVELMGGKIWAYSKTGEGSEFHFTIQLNSLELAAKNPEVDDANSADLSVLEGAKVLLVDDQMLNQELGKELLEDMGCIVDLADDGNEAILKALNNSYDVVLMDLQMPECDGFEASQSILKEKPTLKIIALTANATPDVKKQCTDIGMKEFIGKPFVANTLFNLVAKTIASEYTLH